MPNMDIAERHKGFQVKLEFLLIGYIILGIGFLGAGLIFKLPAALIAAVSIGVMAFIVSDLIWFLDFINAKSEADDEEALKDLEKEQANYNRLYRPFFILMGSITLILLTTLVLFGDYSMEPDKTFWAYIFMFLTFLTGGLIWWVGNKVTLVITIPRENGNPDNLVIWASLTAILLFLVAPAYIGSALAVGSNLSVNLLWFYKIAGAIAIIVLFEVFIRSLTSLIFPRLEFLSAVPVFTWTGIILAGRISLGWKSGGRMPAMDKISDNRLKWLFIFFGKSMPRLFIGIIVVMWLVTSFVQVGISEQGVRERFGAFTGDVLESGVHIGWPWPIDQVNKFPSKQLQVMQVGYIAGENLTRSDMIWTAMHGIEEDRFVTASGSEVISFDIEIYYGINDVVKFAYMSSNPENLLKDIAYKAILLRTNATDSDSLLTRNRAELAGILREDIQASCNRWELGIEVAQVVIIAIHPPFEVASDYQAVVSMQVYSDTLAVQASTYNEEIIPARRAEAQVIIDQASAYAASRVATARGEAAGFVQISDAIRNEFELYRFRRRINALETGLEGKRLYIITSRFIESEEGEDRGLWFDLR